MYEPSRHIATYFIAGFQHWDGALVLQDLKPGTEIAFIPEPDNPYDTDAVALYFKGVKLGYIPGDENALVATASFYGHADIFEVRILQADPEADPWKQVRVGLYLRDARLVS